MTNLKILIVEDECIVARDIQNMLDKLGYGMFILAFSGKEAIKKIEETKPDLVLMDIKLKVDMDGIETAERILSRFDIPIIYISALSDEETLRQAKKTKPFYFVPKPLEETELDITIKEALSRSKVKS